MRDTPDLPTLTDITPWDTTGKPMPFIGEGKITTRVFRDGHKEVTTIDHQGRHYVSRYGPSRGDGTGNFHGTTWVNRHRFENASTR